LAAESPPAITGPVVSADGTKLEYRTWPKEGAQITFAVVPGLGEHAGRYARFAAGMARHGMATFAVDLRGHGKSPGQRGHIDSWSQWTHDASAFIKHVEHTAGTEVVPLGHSFGGAILLSTMLAGTLPKSRRFVVSSAALKLRAVAPGWMIQANRALSKAMPRREMNNQVGPQTLSRIPEVVEEYRSDPLVHNKISSRTFAEWQDAAKEILQRADQIKTPFLILAGTDDALVDPEGSRLLHERAPSTSTLRLLDGRYHEPFNDIGSEEVFQLIADWLHKA
jgi:alpha-beta hydrolase superfamily lysophospholipase